MIGSHSATQLLLPLALCSSFNGNKSTAWFTKDVPHFLEQFSRGVRLWEDFKSLQRFSIVKPVVIQQTPDQQNPHFRAFRAQVLSGIVARHGLHIGARYQQIRIVYFQPVYRLPYIADR